MNTAIATTDIPSNLNILIRQRRRWLNGSFFAGLYAMKEWSRLYTESGHSFGRKLLLTCQLVYLSVNLSPVHAMELTRSHDAHASRQYVPYVCYCSERRVWEPIRDHVLSERHLSHRDGHSSTFFSFLEPQFIYALGNDPRDNKEVYRISYIAYGSLLLFTMFCWRVIVA